jgi:hypothetical protein
MDLKLSGFKETFKDGLKLKHFKKPLTILAALVVLMLVFAAGVFTGLEKARFSYGWRENYYRNFIGERERPMMGRDRMPFGLPPIGQPPFDDYFNAHGVAGEIISINARTASSSALVIKDKDNTEKNILVSARTAIKARRQDLKISDLKVGDKIAAIGAPNDQGQIEAKLIRVAENFFDDFIK